MGRKTVALQEYTLSTDVLIIYWPYINPLTEHVYKILQYQSNIYIGPGGKIVFY